MDGSVSRRFLFGLCLTSLAFTVLTSLAAFCVFEQELENRQIKFLSHYVQERTDNVGRRFSNLITLHKSAVEALNARLPNLTTRDADRLLERHTALLPDGTRRSLPHTFDGYVDADGGRVYGVGAFIGQAASMTPGRAPDHGGGVSDRLPVRPGGARRLRQFLLLRAQDAVGHVRA